MGDLTTRRDGDRLARWCDQVVQISTGQGCHLEAHQVRDALGQIDLDAIDLLFIENVGNLICPVGFDLGQAATVGLFSLTEGDDKAAKHPYLVETADLLLLNKIDLAPYLTFDRAGFEADVRLLNPTVPVLGRLGDDRRGPRGLARLARDATEHLSGRIRERGPSLAESDPGRAAATRPLARVGPRGGPGRADPEPRPRGSPHSPATGRFPARHRG